MVKAGKAREVGPNILWFSALVGPSDCRKGNFLNICFEFGLDWVDIALFVQNRETGKRRGCVILQFNFWRNDGICYSKYVWEVCDIIFGNVPDSLDGA